MSPTISQRHTPWLLYGATGYTGRLIAEEAVRRGHKPVLAGRSAEKLAPLAERLGLKYVVTGIDDHQALVRAIDGLPLVLHAAGPFLHTSEPMRRACLAAGAHYLDLSDELPVFEATFQHDSEARLRGVALVSGVGFDVVATDCLVRYVAERVPGARELDLAVGDVGQVSAGTARSILESLPLGAYVRREGRMQSLPMGQGGRTVRFSDGRERFVLPTPWGDLVTAWHTTGIPNITTYMTLPRPLVMLLRPVFPLVRRALSMRALHHRLERLIDARVAGPNEVVRAQGRTFLWAQARAPDGRRAEAWLEGPEAFTFTSQAALRVVEEVLARSPSGAITPAGAFGTDFALSIPGTRILDSLDEPQRQAPHSEPRPSSRLLDEQQRQAPGSEPRPSSRLLARLSLGGVALALGYLGIMLLVFLGQRDMTFPAPRNGLEPRLAGAALLRVSGREGSTVFALHVPAPLGAPTVVHFHGNGDQLSDLVALARRFQEAGLGFYMVEYPGYGLAAEGEPSEEGLYAAAEVALDHLRRVLGVPVGRTVLQGHSLGTGVAMEMARRGHGAKLVLLAPFTSVADMGALELPWLPTRLLVRDRFDNAAKAPTVETPTLVVHGLQDEVIPVSMGQHLATLLPRSTLQLVAAAHHDDVLEVPGVLQEVLSFARQ